MVLSSTLDIGAGAAAALRQCAGGFGPRPPLPPPASFGPIALCHLPFAISTAVIAPATLPAWPSQEISSRVSLWCHAAHNERSCDARACVRRTAPCQLSTHLSTHFFMCIWSALVYAGRKSWSIVHRS